MIGVDTNVLVRLVAPDDTIQNQAARDFFAGRSAEDPAYVSGVVLAETIWLLRRRFGYPRQAVEDIVRSFLASDDFLVEGAERLRDVLALPNAARSEIADHLIAWSAETAGCTKTVTFDRCAAARVPAMELLA